MQGRFHKKIPPAFRAESPGGHPSRSSAASHLPATGALPRASRGQLLACAPLPSENRVSRCLPWHINLFSFLKMRLPHSLP